MVENPFTTFVFNEHRFFDIAEYKPDGLLLDTSIYEASYPAEQNFLRNRFPAFANLPSPLQENNNDYAN